MFASALHKVVSACLTVSKIDHILNVSVTIVTLFSSVHQLLSQSLTYNTKKLYVCVHHTAKFPILYSTVLLEYNDMLACKSLTALLEYIDQFVYTCLVYRDLLILTRKKDYTKVF